MTKKDIVNKEYICCWCSHKFEAVASFKSGEGNAFKKSKGIPSKKGSCSNQIVCPKCFNCIPTWERIETENGHIHKGRY